MFKAYNIMIGYMYILQNDLHHKSSCLSPHIAAEIFIVGEFLRSTLSEIFKYTI